MELNDIYNMDCNEGLQALASESVDIIFTDPPYLAAMYEQAYGILAEHGPRVLRPGGWLITYAPQYHLPKIMQILGSSLEYYWTVAQLNQSNANSVVYARYVMAMWKPILIYAKPPIERPPKAFCDLVAGKRMKAHHPWEQSIHEALHLLSRFAGPGCVVCDPFTGSGTVPLAAKLLGLNYIGFEIEPATYNGALERLQQTPLDLWSFEVLTT
ncbi:MAG: DNA methyltransferase [Sphaerochaetaceae bacterium]|nr:DNA methyltransferase [Sphaerochaetaceae bacterium]